MTVEIRIGDCREVLPLLAADSIHACVTDPPYALTANKKGGTGEASLNLNSPAGRSRISTGGGFMGKAWDSAIPGPEVWREVLRVLKPGAHLVAFGGTRTYHRLACAIEDAGFEIRDCLGWLYGSGFPKSKNIGGGRGTALKPAWEPIVLARKPIVGTVAENVESFGPGALNIDACRIETPGESNPSIERRKGTTNHLSDRPARDTEAEGKIASRTSPETYRAERAGEQLGRWPANICHDGSDEVLAVFPDEAGAAAPVHRRGGDKFRSTYGAFRDDVDEQGSSFQGDSGSAARFFYCAKASREDRNEGLHGLGRKSINWSSGDQSPGTFQSPNTERRVENHHPTVKPTALMRWLCRLVTPPGGTVLDPFMGSGSTGKAADIEGFHFIGIELDPEYAEIAKERIRGTAPLLAQVNK